MTAPLTPDRLHQMLRQLHAVRTALPLHEVPADLAAEAFRLMDRTRLLLQKPEPPDADLDEILVLWEALSARFLERFARDAPPGA